MLHRIHQTSFVISVCILSVKIFLYIVCDVHALETFCMKMLKIICCLCVKLYLQIAMEWNIDRCVFQGNIDGDHLGQSMI